MRNKMEIETGLALALGTAGLDLFQRVENNDAVADTTRLPAQGSETAEAKASPIVWGPVDPDDELFRAATLPPGWKKVADESHGMWSHLVDARGNRRANIFFKAAFYDRAAHISFNVRYYISYHYHDDRCTITFQVIDKGGGSKTVVVYANTVKLPELETNRSGYHATFDGEVLKASRWLTEHYSNHADHNAYWDS